MLTDDKRITDESKQIIKHLTDNGHIVVIATGRANRLSTFYYQELGLNTPMINSNGAFIHHPLDKKWESYHLPLQLPTAMEVIDLSLSLDAKNVLTAVQEDRKSTRLNSSHVAISYAVFCLKKKNRHTSSVIK